MYGVQWNITRHRASPEPKTKMARAIARASQCGSVSESVAHAKYTGAHAGRRKIPITGGAVTRHTMEATVDAVPSQYVGSMIPRVAFQGELGAFSELAIRQQWPNGATPVPRRTFSDAIASVRNGDAEYAVIPVENAIIGAVGVALEALDSAGIKVVERSELRVPIHLCLLAPRGASLAELRTVHSHAVALAQCRIFFARHGWLEPTPHDDTAGAARMVAELGDRTVGAVASEMAAERYSLEIIARHIQDAPANWTRFLVISAST